MAIKNKIDKWNEKNKINKIISQLKNNEIKEYAQSILLNTNENNIEKIAELYFNNFKGLRNHILEILYSLLNNKPDVTLFYILKAYSTHNGKFDPGYVLMPSQENKLEERIAKLNPFIRNLTKNNYMPGENFLKLLIEDLQPTIDLFDGRPNFNWIIKKKLGIDSYSLDLPFFEKWFFDFFYPLFKLLKHFQTSINVINELIHCLDFLLACSIIKIAILIKENPTIADLKQFAVYIKRLNRLIKKRNSLFKNLDIKDYKEWPEHAFFIDATIEELVKHGKKRFAGKSNYETRPTKEQAIDLYKNFVKNFPLKNKQ